MCWFSNTFVGKSHHIRFGEYFSLEYLVLLSQKLFYPWGKSWLHIWQPRVVFTKTSTILTSNGGDICLHGDLNWQIMYFRSLTGIKILSHIFLFCRAWKLWIHRQLRERFKRLTTNTSPRQQVSWKWTGTDKSNWLHVYVECSSDIMNICHYVDTCMWRYYGPKNTRILILISLRWKNKLWMCSTCIVHVLIYAMTYRAPEMYIIPISSARYLLVSVLLYEVCSQINKPGQCGRNI